VFADVMPLLKGVDLAIANLECPLTKHSTPITKLGPHLCADPACAVGIRQVGFDVVSLANNHILDMGVQGVQDTLTACEQAGLQTVGAGSDLAEAAQPLFINAQDVRVAVLAMTEHEFSIATKTSAGASPLDLPQNHRQIQAARHHADFVLVLLHGGNEYYSLPSPPLAKTCRYLVDVGASAVICSHTHAPSGMEIYHDAPVIYGTGNLLFDPVGHIVDSWSRGYLVQLTVQRGLPTLATLIPYQQCPTVPSIHLMSGQDRQRFMLEIEHLSQIIADDSRLLDHWFQFCAGKRVDTLSTLLCLTRPERQLLRRGIWPFWRARKTHLLALLNTLTCQSHHAAAAAILARELLK
jgi:poly-gamma-glutamate synthesis protein (capsule biosynthesis protein)